MVLKSLLIVTGNFPPDSGGPAKFSENFSIWCEMNDIATQVITYSDKTDDQSISNKRSIRSVNRFLPLPIKFTKLIIAIINERRKFQETLAVGSFLETYIASIFVKFEYVAKVPGDIVWERARNNKVTNLNINEFQEVRLTLKYRIFRIIFTKSLQKARRVIVPSLGLHQLCLNWGVPADKLELVYNSVEEDFYKVVNCAQKDFDIITVCRLVPWKGVGELITYCAENNRKLAIIGDGPLRSELEEYARITKTQVSFYGDISQEEICGIMSRSKIFVLNSSYEGLPHALIEARAAGLLSVARAGTGSAEVIRDDVDGYLVRADRDLNETLETAFSAYEESSDMQSKAINDVNQRFDKQVNYPKIINLLENYSA